MAYPNLNMHTWGFFRDDSSDPDTCTQIGADNAIDQEWPMDTNLMVRIGLDEDGNRSGTADLYIQYQLNSVTGSWTALPDAWISTGTPSDGTACDTQLLDSGAAGSWANGTYRGGGSAVSILHTFDKKEFTEFQFCVTMPSGTVSPSDVVYFRMYRVAGDVFDFTYPDTGNPDLWPQITAIPSVGPKEATLGAVAGAATIVATTTAKRLADAVVSGVAAAVVGLTIIASGETSAAGIGSAVVDPSANRTIIASAAGSCTLEIWPDCLRTLGAVQAGGVGATTVSPVAVRYADALATGTGAATVSPVAFRTVSTQADGVSTTTAGITGWRHGTVTIGGTSSAAVDISRFCPLNATSAAGVGVSTADLVAIRTASAAIAGVGAAAATIEKTIYIMGIVLANRVKETTTTEGTGTVDLAGAETGYQGFVAGAGDGNEVYYAIVGRAGGDSEGEWEIGVGTVTDADPDTLSRDSVIASSNAGSLVDLSVGTKDVFITLPKEVPVRNISVYEPSDVATLDIDISGYESVQIRGWIKQANDGVDGMLRLSNDGGSSFRAGASDYQWCNTASWITAVVGEGDGSDSFIKLGGGVGGDTNEWLFMDLGIFGIDQAGVRTYVIGQICYTRTNGQPLNLACTGWVEALEVNDAIRFLFSAGNITSGRVAVYGYPTP